MELTCNVQYGVAFFGPYDTDRCPVLSKHKDGHITGLSTCYYRWFNICQVGWSRTCKHGDNSVLLFLSLDVTYLS